MRMADLVKDWGGFERLIATLHETGDVSVEQNVVLKGRSGADRQIDVLVRHRTGLYEHLIVVECKHWKKRVERLHVDALANACREVGASKGVIFSTKGFQRGAVQQAEHDGIDLFRVRDLTDREWGLPGQVVDFTLQLFQASAGNITLDVRNTWLLGGEAPSGGIRLNIGLSADERRTHTPLHDHAFYPTLEAIMADGIERLAKSAMESVGKLNDGADGETYFTARTDMAFTPSCKLIVGNVLIELGGVKLDLGIKLNQSRFLLDRADHFAFALAIEDQVRGVTSTASRAVNASVTTLEPVRGGDPVSPEDVVKNGSILRFYQKDYFDFAEIENNAKLVP